jgi:hypothetical protein
MQTTFSERKPHSTILPLLVRFGKELY